jgi:hypothetical protein
VIEPPAGRAGSDLLGRPTSRLCVSLHLGRIVLRPHMAMTKPVRDADGQADYQQAKKRLSDSGTHDYLPSFAGIRHAFMATSHDSPGSSPANISLAVRQLADAPWQ